MHGSRRQYRRPEIIDYGDLWQITATAHPLVTGTVGSNINFSSPGVAPAHGGGTTLGAGAGGASGATGGSATPSVHGTTVSSHGTTLGSHGTSVPSTSATTPATGVTQASGGSVPTASASPADPVGGQLPFTGMVVAAVTGVGAGLVAAGGALRRLVTRRDG